MRIGILTFHTAYNYGAVLQCYALFKLLSMYGHQVEIIDYSIPNTINGLKNKIRHYLKRILFFREMHKCSKAFDVFVKSHIKLSPTVISASDIPSYYDCIVFGSDQIWNPSLCNGFDPIYWGMFPKRNSIFVSYAASIGETKALNNEQWLRIGEMIKVFDKVSVREMELKKCLESKFHINVTYCLDPTLLVDSQYYDSILYKPQETNFIFLYNVQDDFEACDFAKKLAKKLNCKVIRGQAKPSIKNHLESGCYLDECFAPELFLGYIKYARLVLANSFHAIAFSLVFKKNFYSLDCDRPERVKDLLVSVGLLNRHVSSSDNNIEISDIDYSLCDSKLQSLRKDSMAFIETIGIIGS